MEELNNRGKEFINEWNQQVHKIARRIPEEFYENEEKMSDLFNLGHLTGEYDEHTSL